eukprot:NODE_787_length_4254_cov_0.173526.p2 type:complete len:202 gc:universal NODE_787_length_4254_cov_0.173526:3578-4183(+)
MQATDISVVKNPLNLKISGLFVSVFGASSRHAKFESVATELAIEFHKNNYNIVYGGGSEGIMGAGPTKMQELGGQVIGILPRVWEDFCGKTPGHLILVNNLAERKNHFFDYSCAFVAVPGGFGTLDEVLEYITWRQMKIHTKPIILLNTNDFFDGFLRWIDCAHNEGLIKQDCKEFLVVKNNPKDVVDHLNSMRSELSPSF